MKKPEEISVIKVLRDGKELEFTVTLRPANREEIRYCYWARMFILEGSRMKLQSS